MKRRKRIIRRTVVKRAENYALLERFLSPVLYDRLFSFLPVSLFYQLRSRGQQRRNIRCNEEGRNKKHNTRRRPLFGV
jgi:hypothetical protein